MPLALSACGNDTDSSTSATNHLAVAISDAGCDPIDATVPEGKLAIDVTNQGSSKVTEFYIKQNGSTLGEVENVVPGSPKTLTLTLKQGSYTTRCPNGTTAEEGTLNVVANSTSTTCDDRGQGGAGADDAATDVGEGNDDGSIDGTQSGGCDTGTNQPSGSIAPNQPGGNSGGVQPGSNSSPNPTTAR